MRPNYIYLLFGFLLFINLSFSQSYKYVNSETLNLRSSPEIQDDNLLAKLSYGDKVEVLSLDGYWANVKIGNWKGYVAQKYLITSKPLTGVAAINDPLVLICNSKSAYAYHSHYCNGLNKCTHSISKIKISEAKNLNRSACKFCY